MIISDWNGEEGR